MFILKMFKTNENSNSIQVRQQYLRCNYTKFQLKIRTVFRYVLNFQEYPGISFANFTIGMIGNEMGHLLKYAKLYRNLKKY